MNIISLEINEFLDYVRLYPTTDEEMYKYIYRRTCFSDLGLSMFHTQLDIWINKIIDKEINEQNINFLDSLDREHIFEGITNKNIQLKNSLYTINDILDKRADTNTSYKPQICFLNKDDRNRVSTILDYTDPLIKGITVMDGNDYAGEIRNDEKMIQGAKIIKQLFEQYKDFQFDVRVLNTLHRGWPEDRLSSFKDLFDLYYKKVRFLLEISSEQKETPAFVNEPTSAELSSIFTTSNWTKYMDALITCVPALLRYEKETDSYIFIGNKKTQKGCIAQFFKELKNRGKIDQNLNRETLAHILSKNIKEFIISGASIDKESDQYKKIYAKQLESIIKSEHAHC